MEVTHKYLKNALDYCPETGLFTWMERPRDNFSRDQDWKSWNTRFSKKITGYLHKKSGYMNIKLDYKTHLAHRLAFLLMTGSFPENEVDHINQNKTDNKWNNLRDVTSRQNKMNTCMSKRNKSGFTGVCFNKADKKWRVSIGGAKKRINLGCFEDLDEAIRVRKEANIKYGYHPNHGR